MINYNYYDRIREDMTPFYGIIKACENRLGIEVSEDEFEACRDIYYDSDSLCLDDDYQDCVRFLFKVCTPVGRICEYIFPFEDCFDEMVDMDIADFIYDLKDNIDEEDLDLFKDDIISILKEYDIDKSVIEVL